MSQLPRLTVQSPRLIVGLGAAVVAVATLLVALSGQVSALLFVVALLSAAVPRYLGQGAALPGVVLVAVLLFLLPIAWRRTPTSPEQIARFNRTTCFWLLAYLVALLWFGDPSDFSL
jgi:hypothetical protein